MLRSQWNPTKPMYWYGECSWHGRWKPLSILGPTSDENPSSTRKLAASSPEFRNTEHTNHRYRCKIFQCLEMLGMSAVNATFSMDAYKTNVIIWGLFLTSSMIAAIHFWPNYVSNSEIYKNTKFENIENVFNITQKLIQEHSEEILNAKCLEYSSLSWARSVLANDQAMKCAKAKACVYADSFLCIGRMEQAPGATVQRWKGQIEDLRKYSAHQDAVGFDGEAIEFEWIFSQNFWHWLFSRRSRWTWGRELQGQDRLHVYVQRPSVESRWWELHLERWESQELREEILTRTLDICGSRVGKEMVWRFSRSERTVGSHSQENGTTMKRNWSSYLHKHQCFESWNLEAEKRQ